MGLPPTEEDPPSVFSSMGRIKELGEELESSKQFGPINPSPSKVEMGYSTSGPSSEKLQVGKLSPEEREKVEKNTFTFNGREYHAGDEVIVKGRKWFVKEFKPTGGYGSKIGTAPDWDKDVYGRITKEKINPSSMVLRSSPEGENVDILEVMEGLASVEPATPEALAKIEKMKEETGM